MWHWYLLNSFELLMAFVFLYAAYTFTVKLKKKGLGYIYLIVSVLSFGALYMCVQASDIMF